MFPLDNPESATRSNSRNLASPLDGGALRHTAVDAPQPEACSRGPAGAPPSDAALVSGCLRGEAKCWEALVQRYQRLIFAIVRRMGLDEHTAADVFQTVFSRLLTQLPKIAEPARLQAWIVTTTKREGLLQRRRGERWVSMTQDDEAGDTPPEWDIADESPQAEQALADLQQLNRVRLALDRLDPRCRALMRLLFDDLDEREAPMEYGEIAARLGMAVGSIGPTRARCLAKLRSYVS
ncbi:MAG: sigma-70 family RNA polymerase sigma factor [Burkholderiaceae bacterium]